MEEAKDISYIQKRSVVWKRKISRAFSGLMGLQRENGSMMAPKYMAVFPSKAVWRMKRLKRLKRELLKRKWSKSSPDVEIMTNSIQHAEERCGNNTNHASKSTERAVPNGRVNLKENQTLPTLQASRPIKS